MRRCTSLITVSLLALAACGGSDGDTADTTDAPIASDVDSVSDEPTAETEPGDDPAEPTVTDATTPAETTPAETTGTEPAGTEPAGDEAADPSGAVAVTLVEWAVEAPTTIAAGTVTFDVTNGGSFPHHFAIARGESYETLPQSIGGAIDETTLGADFLGRTANLQGGGTETIEFDLEPGNYVFFCNIAGSVSHAAQGQVLSVTVE